MLTNEQIENKDYCTNDVADLKLRFEIAKQSLMSIAGALKHEQPYKAYELAVNDLSRLQGEHNHDCDGDVSLDHNGNYVCKCLLIMSAE